MKKEHKVNNIETRKVNKLNFGHVNFMLTIDDGFCVYKYPLFISNNNSIDTVVSKIYKAFKLKKENGTLVSIINVPKP